MEVAKDFHLASSREKSRRKWALLTRRFHAMFSKRRHFVFGVTALCFVAATLLALLLVGSNQGCNTRWTAASSTAAKNMRLSALARLSEAIYEVAGPSYVSRCNFMSALDCCG